MSATALIRVVGLCGSLRSASYNAMALGLAGDCMPADMTMEVLDWRALPAFDADLLARGMPDAVASLVARIRSADAVLIATPEYNFSVPGMLKNALDWVSRAEDQPFRRKPVAILSAATGPLGGARVQYELRKILLFLDALVLTKPEIFIGHASSKFDPQGRCTDATTRDFVTAQMTAFQQWCIETRAMQVGAGTERTVWK
ncbi:NADPH-dependent FMN reductase [Variovorax paradoxus]|uniref:NADPH-dependent FMN reductase n=1 Tax=Variovorax paradoxus (strain EPS) TaxID=595537 RepID=E6V1Z4_VARPE|nr:NADPH-dependent FMN reductase [Variovorax paradoxus]ADU37997.1 NADPH-dependent FMN reductase [Variovorax paradoxus EPS]